MMSLISMWIPEGIVLLAAIIILLTGLRLKNAKLLAGLARFSLLLTMLATILIKTYSWKHHLDTLISELWFMDHIAFVMKLTIEITAWFVLGLGVHYTQHEDIGSGEYYALTLFAVLGMLIVASAAHFMVLFVGLELFSLAIYALVASQCHISIGIEAAIKYFVTGALASGLLLYGISLIYGATGQLAFVPLMQDLGVIANGHSLLISFGVICILVGVAFKLGVAPFHMWVPDIYEGAPLSVMLWIATTAKIAAFAILVRLLWNVLAPLGSIWQPLVQFLALLSILVGNTAAIAQSNFQRMLAYSSIAHMGYLLLAVQLNTESAWSVALFYMLSYVIGTLTAVAVILLLQHKHAHIKQINDLCGLHQRHPWLAFILLLAMFSLAGVPPLLGFMAKWQIVQMLIEQQQIGYAITAMLLTIVGAYYYLRIIKVIYFDDLQPLDPAKPNIYPPALLAVQPTASIMAALCGGSLLFLGIFPAQLLQFCLQVF